MDASPLSVTIIYVLEGGRGGVNSCPLVDVCEILLFSYYINNF